MARFTCLLAALLMLAGCRSRAHYDYHIQVRNDTSGVIRAKMMRDSETQVITVIDTRVNPHSRGEMVADRRKEHEGYSLHVDAENNPGAPARMPLSYGQTIVRVTREGDDGPFKLETIRN